MNIDETLKNLRAEIIENDALKTEIKKTNPDYSPYLVLSFKSVYKSTIFQSLKIEKDWDKIKEKVKDIGHKYIIFVSANVPQKSLENMFSVADKYNLNVFSPCRAEYYEDDLKYKYVDNIDIDCFGIANHKKDFLDYIDEPRGFLKQVQSPYVFAEIDKAIYDSPKDYERNVYYRIYENPILSTLTIFCDEDKKFIPELKRSLPAWAKQIFVETIESDEEKLEIEQENDNVIFAKWYYKEFHFSKAMNAAKSLSKSKFVLKIDADERLLPHQHQRLYEELYEYQANEKLGGVKLLLLDTQQSIGFMQPSLRLLRNNDDIYYISPIHEQPSIIIDELKKDYITKDSTFVIHHIGYDQGGNVNEKKLVRNIRLFLSEPEILKYESMEYMFLRDCYQLYKAKYLKKEDNNGIN